MKENQKKKMLVFNLPSISVATGALIGLIILFFRLFLSYARLRHIPGPRAGAFTKLWMVEATASGQMVRSAIRQLWNLYRWLPPSAGMKNTGLFTILACVSEVVK